MVVRLFVPALLILLMIADARADLATAGRAFEAGDYGAAYRAYDSLARAGDAEAQYWIGYLLDGAYCGEEDPEHASVWLLKAAEQGHAAAQRMIGAYHAQGRGGVLQDFMVAAEWYAKAAEQGDPVAQRELGRLYQDGSGVDANPALAVDLYAKASAHDDVEAQRDLAYMYYFGTGVPRDFEIAAELFAAAAAAGSSAAEFDLGRLYYRGHGVERDLDAASRHFHNAAEAGHARAQVFLGRMYYRGEGMERSAVKSFVWFQIALAEEREAAAPFLERLRVVLSRAEIASAEQAAADFEPMMSITQLTEIAPAAGPSAEQAAATCF